MLNFFFCKRFIYRWLTYFNPFILKFILTKTFYFTSRYIYVLKYIDTGWQNENSLVTPSLCFKFDSWLFMMFDETLFFFYIFFIQSDLNPIIHYMYKCTFLEVHRPIGSVFFYIMLAIKIINKWVWYCVVY